MTGANRSSPDWPRPRVNAEPSFALTKTIVYDGVEVGAHQTTPVWTLAVAMQMLENDSERYAAMGYSVVWLAARRFQAVSPGVNIIFELVEAAKP